MSRIALLDVNVLLALSNPRHTHHEIAHDWFADHHLGGWATCAVTQNGFIRVLSNAAARAEVGDIYLLGLATRMGGYLATFDRSISLGAVIGATRNTIAVISDGDSDSSRSHEGGMRRPRNERANRWMSG